MPLSWVATVQGSQNRHAFRTPVTLVESVRFLCFEFCLHDNSIISKNNFKNRVEKKWQSLLPLNLFRHTKQFEKQLLVLELPSSQVSSKTTATKKGFGNFA
jgi:hypothetical protein